MDQVQFEENPQEFMINRKAKLSLISRLVIKTGLAKNQQGVNTVLVVCTVVCFLLAGFILWRMYGPSDGGQHAPPLPAQYTN